MKLSEEVLAVLSRCETDGASLYLPEQLDRRLYLAVNKALEAMGGKWSRKVKAHVFSCALAASVVDDAILTGEVATPADFGFFETPEPLADELVAAAGVRGSMRVLEPSAGRGRIVAAIYHASASAAVYAVELQSQNLAELSKLDPDGKWLSVIGGNFLTARFYWDNLHELPVDFDACVMNPPFAKGAAVRHIARAHGMLKKGGKLVSVAPASVLFREDNLHKNFRAMVKEYGGTIERLPEGTFKESGTMVSTCVVTMRK